MIPLRLQPVPKSETEAVAIYDAFGFRVRSFIPLPAPRVGEGRVDWDIVEGAALAWDSDRPSYEELLCGRQKNHFETVGFARFVFEDRLIRVHPAPGLPAAELMGSVTGSLSALMTVRGGKFVLHGTTLRGDGRALIVCGHAGAGKSTQAAQLVCQGWTLHADDVAPVGWTGEAGPSIFPGFDGLRLFPDSLRLLGLNPDEQPWLHRGARKKFATLGPRRTECGTAVPVAGIVILEEGEDWQLRRISGRECVMALLNLQHPAAAREMESTLEGRLRAFHGALYLAEHVPVFHLRRAKTRENLEKWTYTAAGLIG